MSRPSHARARMSSRWAVVLCIAGVLWPALAAGLDSDRRPDSEIESLAAEMLYFSASDFIHNRVPHALSEVQGEQYRGWMDRIIALGAAFESGVPGPLIPSLSSSDPGVRTIALAALYSRLDPEVLPDIALLIDDPESTYPAFQEFAHAMAWGDPWHPPEVTPQTVGQVASRLCDAYLQAVGLRRYEKKHASDLEHFFETHRDLRTPLSLFETRYLWGAEGLLLPSPEIKGELITLQRDLDALPDAQRGWVKLWLARHRERENLIPEEDLIEEVRGLDHQQLEGIFRGTWMLDDPGFEHRAYSIRWWLLHHAGRWASPEWADLFLERGHAEFEYQGGLPSQPISGTIWWRAAAAIDPSRAEMILDQVDAKFADRAERFPFYSGEIDAAKVRFGSERQAAEVRAKVLAYLPLAHSEYLRTWISSLSPRAPTDQEYEFVRGLVHTSRFKENPPYFWLRAIIEHLNGWYADPIVPQRTLYDLYHPMGRNLANDVERAAIEHPEETDHWIETMKTWNQRLIESFAEPGESGGRHVAILENESGADEENLPVVLVVGPDQLPPR